MINFSLGARWHQIVSVPSSIDRGLFLSGNVILTFMFRATPQFDLQQTAPPYCDMHEVAWGYGS